MSVTQLFQRAVKAVDLPRFGQRKAEEPLAAPEATFGHGEVWLGIDVLTGTVACLDQAELRLRELIAGLPDSYFKDQLSVARECVRDARGPLKQNLQLAATAHELFYGEA